MLDSFEEEYKGCTIYIETSADRWNPGYQWSVCRNGKEYDTSISFTIEKALEDAKKVIDELPPK